jgi:hypothetical protein
MEALTFAGLATGARLFFNTFEGFTFRYWGDFEFFVFLTIVNAIYLKLPMMGSLKLYTIAFVAREVVRRLSPTKVEDVPEEKRPKDVVITFKRCTKCSNLYDATQLISFVIFSYLLVAYKDTLVRALR